MVDVLVEIQRPQLLRFFAFLIASHAEGRCEHLHSLELVLEDVAAAISPDDEHDVTVRHLIEVLLAVSADLAHDQLEQVVSG